MKLSHKNTPHLQFHEKYRTFVLTPYKQSDMTRNITIKNPSPKMIQVFDALREKKQQQIKKLNDKQECTFTITV